MIKISVPDDFFQSTEIQNIFNGLAKSVWETLHLSDIHFSKKGGQLQTFRSQIEIKRFLMSEEFDQYKFVGKDIFWTGFKQLPWNTKLDHIIDTNCQIKTIKALRESMELETFEKHCREIRRFRGASQDVRDFKQLAEQNPELSRTINTAGDLEGIFKYERLSSEDRHIIINKLDIPVCPYCNMNYIINFDKNGKLGSTADIDHFYPKSIYPEYSLCLYNMIPSCQACNSRLKLDQDMTAETCIYPYRESFEGAANFRLRNLHRYELNFDKDGEKGLSKQPELELKVEEGAEQSGRIAESSEIFQIESRYKSVSGCTKEWIDKARTYTTYFQQELGEQFKEVWKQASIKELVFGPEETESEFARKSLGKLRRDILRQLGIFK